MSKSQEDKQEQKSSQKTIPTMSSRQQVLYIMNKSKSKNPFDRGEGEEMELLDYHKYFLEKKEHKVFYKNFIF